MRILDRCYSCCSPACRPQPSAALNILACEPEWARAREGARRRQGRGLHRDHRAAGPAPHRGAAEPDRASAQRRPVVCTGAELEIGWLPLLHPQSGNAKMQPGQPGYFEAATQSCAARASRRSVDRSQGDVHPRGNPHIQTDPRNIARVATALAERLAKPRRRTTPPYYQARAEGLCRSAGQQAIAKWARAGGAAQRACRSSCITRTSPIS